MIILDTNVVSALMSAPAVAAVVAWLDRQPWESIWTSSITILEIRFGLETMARGRRRDALLLTFRRLVDEKLEQRVAAFDHSAAEAAAVMMAARKSAGTPVDQRDIMIAGIAAARHATVATRNTKHFAGSDVETVNPWIA